MLVLLPADALHVLLLLVAPVVTLRHVVACPCCMFQEEQTYDGWYNNYQNPSVGVVDSALARRCPAQYQDGVYEPRGGFIADEDIFPSPMLTSERTMRVRHTPRPEKHAPEARA